MVEYIVRECGYPGTIKQEIVGELVRCKDCKWRDEITCLIHGAIWKDNDFCSYGENEVNNRQAGEKEKTEYEEQQGKSRSEEGSGDFEA